MLRTIRSWTGKANTPRVAHRLRWPLFLLTVAVLSLGAAATGGAEQDRARRADAASQDKTEEAAQPSVTGKIPRVSRTGSGTLDARPSTTAPRRARARTRQQAPQPVAKRDSEIRHQGSIASRSHAAQTLAAPTVSATAEAADPATRPTRQLARSSGPSNELTIFRNTVVSNSGYRAVEPTAANDRNGILATGNLYASVSEDNGLTFSSAIVDPEEGELHGGACCDQVAYAVDRGSYSLVFWLVQDYYLASTKRNALRLHYFKGRGDLLAGQPQCDWTFEPADFGLDVKEWFDFNQISHTQKYLYVTTNVRDADKENDPRVGGLIFRVELDDIDDDDCQIGYRYWYEKGHPYLSPVQNAGATMHLATRVYDFLEGDNLRIYSIRDQSNDLEHKDKDVENYKDKKGNCPLPDGNDPCEDQHEGRMSGFRVGGSIGWLWMADEDGEFPFPHVRVAVFETGSKKKVLEHQIWSDEFAWQLPSVGVNSEGHLGVILYAMGGGRFPNPQAFIRTDPRNWSGIQMTAIANSTSGVDGWGHFGSVRPYGNCPETFLGSAYTSEGGTQKGRLVWFGLEGTGCEDLVVTEVSTTGSSPIAGRSYTSGGVVDITTTVENQGAGDAPASTIGYYLSRNQHLDDDDIRFPSTRTANALDPVENHTLAATISLPSVSNAVAQDFYVIACADDAKTVPEVTDTNNCTASSSTVSVRAKLERGTRATVP